MDTTCPPVAPCAYPFKVISPEPICPYQKSAAKNLPGFEALNQAFQLTTGWTLGYHETPASRQQRIAAGSIDIPICGQLTIDDMSNLWPAGIPATSRRRCESLTESINDILNELDNARQEKYQLERKLAWVGAAINFRAFAHDDTDDAKSSGSSNCPTFFLSNIAITPLLSVGTGNECCGWQVAQDQKINFGLFGIDNRCQADVDPQSRFLDALPVVKTAFHCYADQQMPPTDILSNINRIVYQSFLGDVLAKGIVFQTNPLSGAFEISYRGRWQCFRTSASGVLPMQLESALLGGETNCQDAAVDDHLGNKEHLLIIDSTSIPYETSELIESFAGQLTGKTPAECRTLFAKKITNRIPRVTNLPSSMVLISRT